MNLDRILLTTNIINMKIIEDAQLDEIKGGESIAYRVGVWLGTGYGYYYHGVYNGMYTYLSDPHAAALSIAANNRLAFTLPD